MNKGRIRKRVISLTVCTVNKGDSWRMIVPGRRSALVEKAPKPLLGVRLISKETWHRPRSETQATASKAQYQDTAETDQLAMQDPR